MHITFNGNILIIGCGAVSQCLQPLLARHFDMDLSRITLIDKLDNKHKVDAQLIAKGAHFFQETITPENYPQVLGKYLSAGDLLIDLAVNIDTIDLIDWCQQQQVLYINTALEQWENGSTAHPHKLINATLYARHMQLREKAKQWNSNGPTAIIEHGANPGLVTHWTKSTLITLAQEILKITTNTVRKQTLEQALLHNDFAQLSYATNTQVIHIAERDMQITNRPKQVNEFVNTWSVDGFYEEGIAPAELGWGTHEKTLPKNAITPDYGPKNQIFLAQAGMDTFMHSWVPSGDIIGMLIRHGESFTISDYLTLHNDNHIPLYRPTVHYVYTMADVAIASAYELRMRGYVLQPRQRILNDDIIAGKDELGVLLLGHDLNGWWTGSQLSIEETRQLVDGQNATTLQVAASLLGALFWMIKNPNKGFCTPENLPHDEVLSVANNYLGTCLSIQTDWNPLNHTANFFDDYKQEKRTISPENKWQFESFRVLCS